MLVWHLILPKMFVLEVRMYHKITFNQKLASRNEKVFWYSDTIEYGNG